MPPKKNIKKVKAKAKPKTKIAIPLAVGNRGRRGAKLPTAKTQPTKIDNRRITNKPQTQSVNVNVSVGKESERPAKSISNAVGDKGLRQSKISPKMTAPTIIPQYIQGNPPPMPPTPPPIIMSQSTPKAIPLAIPTKTPSIITSLGSLDDVYLSDKVTDTSSVRSYNISEPLSELTTESYNYSTPSGIGLKSINSMDNKSSPITKNDIASLIQSLKKKVLEPRIPFSEIVQSDGSIKLISEENPSILDMTMLDQPISEDKPYEEMTISERIEDTEKKKRGRKKGGKNRPKEEIKAEREEIKAEREEKVKKGWIKTQKGWERELEREQKELKREQIMQGNRDWTANQLDRILGESTGMVDERDISNLKEI